MSFGFGVGDLLAVTQLARGIWRNFEDSTDQFKAIRTEVANLYLLLDEIKQTVDVRGLSKQQEQDLSTLVQGCRNVFTELQLELSKYEDLDVKHKGLGAKSHNAWKKLKWDPGTIESFRSRIIANTALLNAYNGSLVSKISLAIRDDVAGIDRHVQELKQEQDHQEKQKVVDWLSPLNFLNTQTEVYGRQQEGTGQWLLQSSAFQDWINGNKEILWCPGIPGAGKTVLSSIVINHLQSILKSEDIAVAWIYCDYKQKNVQTFDNLVGSLLKQLAQQRKNLSGELQTLHNDHVFRGTRPSGKDIVKALQSEIKGIFRTFIVVDALDECSEESGIRNELVENLRSLSGNMNLLVTSRYIPSIEREISQAKRIDIHAKEEDLRKYVTGRIHRERRLLRHVNSDPSLQDLIVNKIVGNVAGMFLLAQLHIDSLVSKNNRKAVREALSNLPKGLDDTYEEAMVRINGQNQEDRELAEKVLMWITCAKRPLSVRELQHAVAIEDGDTETDFESFPDEEILISVCAGLVTIDAETKQSTETKEVRLVRMQYPFLDEQGTTLASFSSPLLTKVIDYTTQSYFERIRSARYPKAQSQISVACLTCLLFDCFAGTSRYIEKEAADKRSQNPIYDYAASNWGFHAQEIQDQRLLSLALQFLLDGAKSLFAFWVMTYDDQAINPNSYMPYPICVHIVAYFGLSDVLALLLQKYIGPDYKSYRQRTPLSIAAERGHVNTAALLLAAGADVNSHDTFGQTPLWWAVKSGHIDITNLLLENGADPKLISTRFSLIEAAGWGNKNTVKLLLEKGADINIRHSYSAVTALACACSKAHYDVVELLLKRGARHDIEDIEGRTPISRAAEKGHLDMVRLLLTEGGEPETRSSDRRTPLSWAAGNQHEAVVKLLLAKGADKEHKDSNYGRTPLSWSVTSKRGKVAKLLLEAGANPNIADKYYGQAPLSWAARYSDIDTMKLLLEYGAMLDAKDFRGQTALSWARTNAAQDVARLLRDRGAADIREDWGANIQSSHHLDIPTILVVSYA